jgi:2-iminobutanoate/2-iminopropanoate deaminase
MAGFEIINNTKAPKAVGTYSQGAQVGNIFFFSGQIGMDPETGSIVPGFKEQTQQILKNIDALLEGTGLSRDHIFKTTIFLTDLSYFGTVNELYQEYFKAPFPARSCVEVTRLPKDALIEIEVMATK